MKKSPTLLMKELKEIKEEISQVHYSDEDDSYVPVDDDFEPRFENSYSYENNRQRIKELQNRESQIRKALNSFNINTKVSGMDLTVSEALVKISQLRNEIRVLSLTASKQEFFKNQSSSYRYDDVYKTCYDINVVKKDLKSLREELAEMQVAIDKTNLNSLVDC